MNKLESKLLNINKPINELKQDNINIIQDIKLRKTMLTAFDEYKELCISQNLSNETVKSKERLNKLFKENKIKYLDEINQKFINEIVNKYQKDTR